MSPVDWIPDSLRQSLPAFVGGWIMYRFLIPIAGDRHSARVRNGSDRQLRSRVMLAAARLPKEVRGGYEREWAGELHHILHGPDARPVVRLWRGWRYTRGLRRAARELARIHEGPRTAPQRLVHALKRARGLAAVYALGFFVGGPILAVFLLGVAAMLAAAALWAALRAALWAALWTGLAAPVRALAGRRSDRARSTSAGHNALSAAYRDAFSAGCRVLHVSWVGRTLARSRNPPPWGE
jgi:hypothetical protein